MSAPVPLPSVPPAPSAGAPGPLARLRDDLWPHRPVARLTSGVITFQGYRVVQAVRIPREGPLGWIYVGRRVR